MSVGSLEYGSNGRADCRLEYFQIPRSMLNTSKSNRNCSTFVFQKTQKMSVVVGIERFKRPIVCCFRFIELGPCYLLANCTEIVSRPRKSNIFKLLGPCNLLYEKSQSIGNRSTFQRSNYLDGSLF
jgi:hypothetical protein